MSEHVLYISLHVQSAIPLVPNRLEELFVLD